ncbi:MAG: gliding motility protein GldC [Candidatus Nitrotoga sp.]|nr:gliding motility protein GldC [Candidatus Nitrotoga sp.]RFC34717.1 MAG: protein involved in gliding motility GldC [Candidatus Nitrotoga sp. LAW]RFC38671.1 MAG: protein involved in gliding motility GldC [Candidatus Nitrotoga sp. CP45]MDO9447387.1 gliding motility protein GldC [Candidatus Nitrotoga sp.]MDP1638979.1 gliding motility protein GldC [Candidatus Nitrotoga sp.]
MTKSEIKFTVTLDDNMVAEKIDWSASDAKEHNTSKGVMISVWDAKESNTMRIDFWTKDMMVDEMCQFYHQTFLSMADTFERATGEMEAAKSMRNFAQQFGEKVNLFTKKKFDA